MEARCIGFFVIMPYCPTARSSFGLGGVVSIISHVEFIKSFRDIVDCARLDVIMHRVQDWCRETVPFIKSFRDIIDSIRFNIVMYGC